MSWNSRFGCDGEFVKLLSRRSDIDLTVAALEIARDATPDLEFGPVLNWIDDRAAEIRREAAAASDEREMLQVLVRCVAVEYGITGDPAAWDQPESSYLPQVIETGCGLPITLSLLYSALAGRLGIELTGVAAPMHFLTRFESVEGPLFLDAWHDGRIQTQEQCEAWLSECSGQPVGLLRPHLQPAHPRCIIIRMLNNLKAVHVQREAWDAAWIVQHRLTALQPSSYAERRDLALISLRANRPGPAMDLLRDCLKTCSSAEKPVLEDHLADAARQVTRWN